MAPTTVAYLIASTMSPEQTTRLAAVLRAGSPRGVIAVRQDEAAGTLDLRRLHELDVDLLETTSVERGSAAELMMLLRCLRQLLQSRFDWLVLISGSDYPVRPVIEIEASLAGADTDGFIETHACEPPTVRRGAPVDEHVLRYHYRWSAPRQSRPFGRALAAALSPHLAVEVTPAGVRIGVPAKRSPFKAPKRKPLAVPIKHNPLSSLQAERSPFGEGLECRYGLASFTLSRRAVEVIDAAVREHPELVLYYRDTLHPVESYIHTVLANDRSLSLVDDGRRLDLSGAVDLDVVLASGADFAGPFDADAGAGVLDAIDARVHDR
jgi:Core-2/I-Branching enzyme